jgi:hypothetical protein
VPELRTRRHLRRSHDRWWPVHAACRECWHSDHYRLPALNKKVIYLDQMVISHMTKALHPTAAAGRDIHPFWRELFEKLDLVCKMQLAICPDSEAHREESAVWTHPEALRKMYERPFSFDAVYWEELRSIGRTTIQMHVQSMREAAEMMAGRRPFDPDVLMPSNATAIILGIHHRLHEHGVGEEDLWQKTVDFFASPDLDQVPYLRISCMLFAAFARKHAIGGQRRPAGGGTLNDVTTVATLMPACDAIYVDNEIAAFFAEEPLRSRLDFGALVFSQRTRHEFAAYLDEIRAAASDEHVAAVREVYGDRYLHPFTGLFDGPE